MTSRRRLQVVGERDGKVGSFSVYGDGPAASPAVEGTEGEYLGRDIKLKAWM